MDNELKIGDLVVLKGGSPKMTIVGFGYNGDVTTMWFPVDINGEYLSPQTVSLSSMALEKTS